VLIVPALAIGLYLKLTGYDAGLAQTQVASAEHPQGTEMPSVEEMIVRLTRRMQSTPDDVRGWIMLARSYLVLQRYAEASQAYAKAYALHSDDPALMSDYAEALALAANGSLAGRPTELVSQALELQPDQPKALWLAGIAAMHRGDATTAVRHWQKLLVLLPPGSEDAQMIEQALAQAGAELAPPPQAATGTQAALQVRVSLAPALADRVAPDDALFIFARAVDGPRMPLVVVRKQVKDLPLMVMLDDSMAMTPAMKLSSFPEVVVEARISKSGNGVPGAGDLQGQRRAVTADGEQVLDVSIDQVFGETPVQTASAAGTSASVPAAAAEADVLGAAAADEAAVGDDVSEQASVSPEAAATPRSEDVPALADAPVQADGVAAIAPAEGGNGPDAMASPAAAPSSAAATRQVAAVATGAVPQASTPRPSGSRDGIEVHVELAPHLAAKVSPQDTVFVYARAAQGPRMPLVVVRKQVKDLPFTVTLDDSMAMVPTMRLSSFPQLVVGARISKSGTAMPVSGDLQGLSPAISSDAHDAVELTIDNIVP
jgi:cytochrome c-type biogenesis protein CcmH